MQHQNSMKILCSIVTVFAVLLQGCAAQYVPIEGESPKAAIASLAVGDRVRITTLDGSEITTTVESVEDDVVIGEDRRIPVPEISMVEIQQQSAYDPGEVARVIWVYALLGYLVVLAF